MPPGLLEIGSVIRPHGLRGEVVVALVSNRHERLVPGSQLSAELAGRQRRLEVLSSRPFQDRHLVCFAGVGDRDAAEALRGARLLAEAIEDPDAYFVHDLIGAEVFEQDGTPRGTVTSVESNPASDLLVLDGGRALVPLRFVVERTADRLVVEVPEGLFE